MTLLPLATRVEALDGPDREVDALERITGVAIMDGKQRLWSLPPPHRHGSIFALAAFTREDAEGGTQGFTTSLGRFVDRKEAWVIAVAAGQEPRQTGGAGTLYSEDLW